MTREPSFQRYPQTPAEFSGVMANKLSGCLLGGAARLLDALWHVAVPERVQRPVRGWEGRVWEVGDGEVDGPVAPGGLKTEGEIFDYPSLELSDAEFRARLLEYLPDGCHVVVGEDGHLRTEIRTEEGGGR